MVRRYPDRHYLLEELAQDADLSSELAKTLRSLGLEAQALNSARVQNEARFAQATAHRRAKRYADAFLYMRAFSRIPRGIFARIACWLGR